MATTSQNELVRPTSRFEINDGLAEWDVPAKEWLTTNEPKLRSQNLNLDELTTGVLVFNDQGEVLMIQRASHDSFPDKFEIPGGGVDKDDATIIDAAVRELLEETGLVAKRVKCRVTDGSDGNKLHVFQNSRKTSWFCRVCFEMEVETYTDIRLDPNEHQDFVWATEAEVRDQRIGDRDVPITSVDMQSIILEAFRLRNGA
ncbi:hypothetical protein GQ53DRAFT_20313 [Thozetella sp. PMI_491]|nr:hypothetical protein GQ53DRAFT_20313 [Thozetella sp. PMI_491]